MKSNRKPARRDRWAFSEKFKAEVVRMVMERRATGASLAQTDRELVVRRDQLRAWTRLHGAAPWTGAVPPGETLEQENRRLRHEVATLRQEEAFVKSGDLLRESVAVMCAVIARHEDEYPVRLMCRVLAVSLSGYFAYRQRPERWRAVIDDVLMAHVRMALAESGETDGAPGVHHSLRAAGPPRVRSASRV